MGRHHERDVNYAGFAGLALAAWYLVRHRRSPVPVALALAGLVALVLALGPVIKFHVVPPGGAGGYNMPASAAPALPWGGAIDDVPGIESIRRPTAGSRSPGWR